MSEKNVQYRQAKSWQLALVPAANCVPTLFVILMTFASYVAVGVYGATTVLAGTIITGTLCLMRLPIRLLVCWQTD